MGQITIVVILKFYSKIQEKHISIKYLEFTTLVGNWYNFASFYQIALTHTAILLHTYMLYLQAVGLQF